MNEEERIIALEMYQVQLQKDFSILVNKQTEMFNQQIQLDKTMTSVLVKSDARFDELIQLEKTIRHFDDSIKELTIKFERSPVEHNRVVTSATEKLWEALREQELRFQDFKMESHNTHTNLAATIKKELMTTAKNHISLLYACVVLGALMVGAFYVDIKSDIKDNTDHIDDHHVQHNTRTVL